MFAKYLKLLGALARAFWKVWFTFPGLRKEAQLIEIQHWSRDTLQLLGVRLNICTSGSATGTASAPQLLVSNHISWLDVLIMQALQPSIFVAKAELQNWPVLGTLTRACGVIYVKRTSPQAARQMASDATQALACGFHVACFPEGTSTDGRQVQAFHANVFESAIRRNASVQPLALRYTDLHTGQHCMRAAFVGERGFLPSLHQVIRSEGMIANVVVCEPLTARGHSRKSLAQLTHLAISSQLHAHRLNNTDHCNDLSRS